MNGKLTFSCFALISERFFCHSFERPSFDRRPKGMTYEVATVMNSLPSTSFVQCDSRFGYDSLRSQLSLYCNWRKENNLSPIRENKARKRNS